PYVWISSNNGVSSWQLFDLLLNECHLVGTPGVGFGRSGEGCFRLTAFNTYEKTIEAVNRLKRVSI
ncbi:MAG: LL-diaminopimelate aminotransferase, partial [Muribaculaceae bacterium]